MMAHRLEKLDSIVSRLEEHQGTPASKGSERNSEVISRQDHEDLMEQLEARLTTTFKAIMERTEKELEMDGHGTESAAGRGVASCSACQRDTPGHGVHRRTAMVIQGVGIQAASC